MSIISSANLSDLLPGEIAAAEQEQREAVS